MAYSKPRSFGIYINGREVSGITEIREPRRGTVQLVYEDGRRETWRGRLLITGDPNLDHFPYSLDRAYLWEAKPLSDPPA